MRILCAIRIPVRIRILLGMRIFFLPLPENGFQLGPVGGDHLLLLLGGLDDHRHLVAVGADQGLAALKLGNGAKLRPRQLQHFLYGFGFIRLQIQNDLVLGIVDDGSSVLAVLKAEEVRKILRRRDGSAAEAADRFEDRETELRRHAVGACADQLTPPPCGWSLRRSAARSRRS